MRFTELEETEFAEFSKNHEQKNFYQTINMYRHLIDSAQETYLVGIKDDNAKILCASLITSTSKKTKNKTFQALKGFLIDYRNKELLKTFTDEVRNFVKRKGGFRLFIEPYLALIERNSDAKIVEGGFNNQECEKNLFDLGYKSIDLGVQVKWIYCLDINGKTPDELFKTFASNTRNYINKTYNKFKLNYKTLTYEQLKEFKKITTDTCERRSFSDKSLEYYESMYKHFGTDVTFKVIELNCDDYLNSLIEETKELNSKINELSDSSSNKNKKEQMKQDILNNENKINEIKLLKQEKGNIIPLSGAMFILYGDEIIYLFSGSYQEYFKFFGQYRIQWEIIKYAAEENYKRYNFFGIKDPFDKNNKDFGVYEFKKSFNGYVEELMGPYEIGCSSYYKFYNLLRKIKKIIKK